MSTLFYVSYLALWLLMLAEGALIFLLYRHFGLMALGALEGVQRDGLRVGAEAPPVSAMTAEGAAATWAPSRDRRSLLVFVAPNCGPCAAVMPAIGRLAGAGDDSLDITAIVAGAPEAAAGFARKFRLPFRCLAEAGRGAAERYRVRVTPFAFLIDEDGRILAKGLCSDAAHLQELLMAGGSGGLLPTPEAAVQMAPRGQMAAAGIQEAAR
jgi:methylamine dehydrogenase accessory protein MauD